jgi:peptidoglycan/xylan/chitin deacetylase (PgdA/CDA1 family)
VLLLCSVAIGPLGAFLSRRYRIPVLMYHSVDDAQAAVSSLAVSTQSFRKQMSFLKRRHYRFLSLAEFVSALENKERLPRRAVVVTFDDGYENNYTAAYPILKELGIPACIFVTTGHIGKTIDDQYFKRASFLSVEQLHKLADDSRIEIASHGVTHRYLPKLAAEDLRREIVDSKHALETMLKRPVRFFSYPIGGFNTLILSSVRDAGYAAATTTNRGYASHGGIDRFAIQRIKISDRDTGFRFWVKVSGYYTALQSPKGPE